jgi:ectoine hydroxylase-related dioxygenase (phytanoyl-CoA dioxygenase family)
MAKTPTKYDPRYRPCCGPTPHLAVAQTYLEQSGLAVLSGVLDRDQVASVRAAISAAQAPAGNGDAASTDPAGVSPVGRLVLAPVIQGLLEHPIVNSFVTARLGSKPRLSFCRATARAAGATAGPMHAGQGYISAPWPATPLTLTAIWAIDPFIEATGTLRVMPDSANYDHGPESDLDYPEAAPLLGPAGSLIVMDGRVWHRSGANTTADPGRTAVFAHYVRPWILPEAEWRDVIPPGQRDTLSPGLRELLGFGERATEHVLTRHGQQIWPG